MASIEKLPSGFTLHRYDILDSTNLEAKRLIKTGACSSGAVVLAQAQTIGRGKQGRRWVSEPGNLFCSIALHMQKPAITAAELVFVAALAVKDALALPCRLKWPNDILVQNKKIAGILLESFVRNDGVAEWVIVGAGINITSHPKQMDWPATDLHQQGARGVSVDTVLTAYLQQFKRWYAIWEKNGFEPVRKEWLAHGMEKGTRLTIRSDGTEIQGLFEDIDSQGALKLVNNDGKTLTLHTGDVFY